MFDFGEVRTRETLIRKTWHEFRCALARKDFSYDDTNVALTQTFLKVFDDIHNHMSVAMKCELSAIKAKVLLRGTVLDNTETPDYDRMLPNAKFISKDNRFSPPGIEWLYLAVGDKREDALACSKAECRVTDKDIFASCHFEIDEKTGIQNIIDLTIADGLSTKEINDCLEKAGQKYKNKAMRRSFQAGIIVPSKETDKVKMKAAIEQWAFRTYMKLLSEQIFIPVSDTYDKSLMYAPFQCMAQYFILKGYSGIVYKSTVSDKGKNLVLFDKNYAKPVGDIIIEES